MDSIYALATPLGGAIAIIRISGEKTRPVLDRVFLADTREPRRMAYGPLTDGEGRVDMAMGCFFQGPHSYTGEDMGELYIHASPAVARRAFGALEAAGLRAAAPGEFTRRAFLNGKLDLSEAEAVMDLISAQSERSASLALEQLQGSLSARIREIEGLLVEALAALNAAIDYPEELEEDAAAGVPPLLEGARGALAGLIRGGLRARVYREGARVAIVGRPNVGKSSLLNALLGRERAIVTELPGTTRDILEEPLVLGGLPLRLMDTAGIREAADRAEALGVSLSEAAMDSADLLLIAADQGFGPPEQALLERTAGRPRMLILGKGDLGPVEGDFGDVEVHRLSARTGEGLEELKAALVRALAPGEGESALCTNMRHLEALKRACALVESALAGGDADCVATDIQLALQSLGAITGSAVTEAVIDNIFSRFCVGK